MGSTRRRFTEEYKEEAVSFVIDGGRSVAEVARNIGVHEMTLGKWVKRARDERGEQASPLTGSERAVPAPPASLLSGSSSRPAWVSGRWPVTSSRRTTVAVCLFSQTS